MVLSHGTGVRIPVPLPTFSTVLLQFVPKLRYFGVPDAAIHKILVDNPRRFLAFEPRGA